MTYCEVTDVLDVLKESMIDILLGETYIEDPAERRKKIIPLIAEAIADADAEINGYLHKLYNLPFSNTPKILKKFSKDIATYNLVSRIGIDESDREKTYLNRYHAAIKFLTSVASGTIELGVISTKEKAKTGFKIKSSKRLFSRSSMDRW